jgi:sugar phosphate isomerase/epimerase
MQVGVMNAVLEPSARGGVFETARRLTFDGVEIDVGREELGSHDRLASLLRERAASGLDVPSLVLGELSDRGGIADADPGVAEAARFDVERAITWASELGAGAILVPFFGRGELHDEADLDRAAGAFRGLCRTAGDADVVLCYEGTLPAEAIQTLAGRVASRAFGCYFDLANVVARGMDSATEIRALGSLVRRVHLKDVRVTVGDCAPGLGSVDFAESARALDEIGYDDWVVLETPPRPRELVARDLSFARSVLPRLPPPEWPRLGIFTYEFGRGEWERAIETCKRVGLTALQLGGPLLEECVERLEDVESVVAQLDDAGISIVALAGYRNLVAPDDATRRAGLDFLLRCLELATLFGTSVVATETGTRSRDGDWEDSPENTRPEASALLEESLAELVAAAEQAGAVLALEAHVKNVLRSPVQLLGLLERFASPHLQVVLDPYNYVSHHLLPAHERLTRAYLDRFEHRFVLAHLKDIDPGGADVGTIEFGTGSFAQAPYIDFLAKRRPDLPLILEHLPLEHLPAAIRRVLDMRGGP